MNEFWEKVEHYNAKLITPAIVALLFVIVVELGFQEFAEHYHILITIFDTFVICVFVIDLIFLAVRAKSTVYFFKHYWLDIIAIFPFVLMMNLISRVYQVFAATGKLAIGQAILHESLEAKKGISALSKAGRFARWIRIGVRMVRVVTKSRLFTHFHARHHLAKRNLKKGYNQRAVEKARAKNKKMKMNAKKRSIKNIAKRRK
ncbi:hypothetical protein COV17_02340 [Candidatus Woesearchaeota archaeon CG10_big_fil_rev_8_21_14_0_10_36_11]|nr:MAG: hypothetical protein COV17_02340 [Candidatus Woesearchaeota archaeon CG10_big_fil_rev_8_21_14_0_10_36_11]